MKATYEATSTVYAMIVISGDGLERCSIFWTFDEANRAAERLITQVTGKAPVGNREVMWQDGESFYYPRSAEPNDYVRIYIEAKRVLLAIA